MSENKKFGNLLIVSTSRRGSDGRLMAFCRCDCGKTITAQNRSVVSGNTSSCGCLRIKKLSVAWMKNTTHGKTETPEYSVWASMMTRCTNPKASNFKHYGARGIYVCGRWQKFSNFIRDMGARPSSRHTIERKNSDGNYEPSNCRWATRKEQANNRRSNRMITFNGKTQSVSMWADEVGISAETIRQRLIRGWSMIDTLHMEVEAHA